MTRQARRGWWIGALLAVALLVGAGSQVGRYVDWGQPFNPTLFYGLLRDGLGAAIGLALLGLVVAWLLGLLANAFTADVVELRLAVRGVTPGTVLTLEWDAHGADGVVIDGVALPAAGDRRILGHEATALSFEVVRHGVTVVSSQLVVEPAEHAAGRAAPSADPEDWFGPFARQLDQAVEASA